MLSNIETFCRILRSRSKENKESIDLLFQNRLYGNCISILRQELDSMIRIIYLLSTKDDTVVQHLIDLSLKNESWYLMKNNKKIHITDKDMVERANELNYAWTKSVYKFGCSFIHLSNYHDYTTIDPFSKIQKDEKEIIRGFIRAYQHVELQQDYSFRDVIPIIPRIFDKITNNYECEIDNLEARFGLGNHDFNWFELLNNPNPDALDDAINKDCKKIR